MVLVVAVVLVVVLGQVEPIFGLCGPMLGVLCATYVDILLRFDFFLSPLSEAQATVKLRRFNIAKMKSHGGRSARNPGGGR